MVCINGVYYELCVFLTNKAKVNFGVSFYVCIHSNTEVFFSTRKYDEEFLTNIFPDPKNISLVFFKLS